MKNMILLSLLCILPATAMDVPRLRVSQSSLTTSGRPASVSGEAHVRRSFSDSVRRSLLAKTENGLTKEEAEERRRDEIYDEPALIEAVRNRDLAAVRDLLDHHADIHKADRDGWTPLFIAACHGYTEIVQLLLNHHADVNKASHDGRTPLYMAASENCAEVVQLLLDHGADVNGADKNGTTPLNKTVRRKHLEIVQLLLDHGADMNIVDGRGDTPYTLAEKQKDNHPKIYELMDTRRRLQSKIKAVQPSS